LKRNPAERVAEAASELGVLPELLNVRQTHDRIGLEEAFRILKEATEARAKELALKYHPDRPGGDLDRMKRINVARDILRAVSLNAVPVERPMRATGTGGRRPSYYAPNMPPVRTVIPLRTNVTFDGKRRVVEQRGGWSITWDPLDYNGVPEESL